jgi:hypothetical protein
MPEDTIRVFRMVEYVGPRSAVEAQIRLSLHGTRVGHKGEDGHSFCVITATTLGEFAELVRHADETGKEP